MLTSWRQHMKGFLQKGHTVYRFFWLICFWFLLRVMLNQAAYLYTWMERDNVEQRNNTVNAEINLALNHQISDLPKFNQITLDLVH